MRDFPSHSPAVHGLHCLHSIDASDTSAAAVYSASNFLAHHFPQIHIDACWDRTPPAWGCHLPGLPGERTKLHINQALFDGFEETVRRGQEGQLFLWFVFVTVAHEFAHYLVSVGLATDGPWGNYGWWRLILCGT